MSLLFLYRRFFGDYHSASRQPTVISNWGTGGYTLNDGELGDDKKHERRRRRTIVEFDRPTAQRKPKWFWRSKTKTQVTPLDRERPDKRRRRRDDQMGVPESLRVFPGEPRGEGELRVLHKILQDSIRQQEEEALKRNAEISRLISKAVREAQDAIKNARTEEEQIAILSEPSEFVDDLEEAVVALANADKAREEAEMLLAAERAVAQAEEDELLLLVSILED